jgi:Cu(I)/Ag(I) efflux system membrane fusion protein
VIPLPAETAESYTLMIRDFVQLAQSLAADQTNDVGSTVRNLSSRVESLRVDSLRPESHAEVYVQRLDDLHAQLLDFAMTDIEASRVAFGRASSTFIELITHFRPPLSQPVYVMQCGMWKKSPDFWLQLSTEVANPFYGERMLGCGEVVGTWGRDAR